MKTEYRILTQPVEKVLTAFFIAVCLSFSAIAANAQEEKKSSQKQLIVNTVPKTVPIKIEISDNDFNSPPEQFVIRITNTGDKPIYLINLNVRSAEKITGNFIGLGILNYGNVTLGDFTLSAEQTAQEREKSESLAANESVELVITKEQVLSFRKFLSERNYRDFPRMILNLSVLSFGDGTGFMTPTAVPMPYKAN